MVKTSTAQVVRRAPKVQLHDHLDGGLRPQTVIELAEASEYRGLPTRDAEKLAQWFHQGAYRGSLVEYLQGFQQTVAVMQTESALERVAYEMMEDMREDGVLYIETRFAPVLHTERGLHCEEIVGAVLHGLERGKRDFGVGFGLIICGMRNLRKSLEMAELAVNHRNQGVVGFDLAGEEGGFPPKEHLDAFQFIKRENFNITIHAGEAFGKVSIWQAIQYCGAHRIGHATRLTDDIAYDREGNVVALGELAQYILDRRIPLEVCLLSNLHTGAVDRLENHPFKDFYRLGFRVFLNTDDRLMSDTTLTGEYLAAMELFDLNLDDLERLTLNAIKSAFCHRDEKLHYIYDVIKPGFETVRDKLL